jgi:hypothetical protein
MTGDTDDMARRISALLPQGWFGDDTPILDAVLQGVGTAFSAFWMLLTFVICQTRIATASGMFLDMISGDFFGQSLFRYIDESDDAFRTRIAYALLRPRATRAAIVNALQQLTGRAPAIFEPSRTSDTGGYTIGGVGYGAGGGWGSLALPYQFFLTAYRPSGGGIAALAGYGTGGIPVYGDLTMQAENVSDAIIQAAVPPLLPAGSTAWMRISN